MNPTARPIGILFVCSGNSCRSQMAEGFGRAYAPEGVAIYSGGTFAAGVHPLAIEVMREVGIDISKQQSKPLALVPRDKIDVVVTLCDAAAAQCPVFPAGTRQIHRPVADPVGAPEPEGDRLTGYRRARDEIEVIVKDVLRSIANEWE